MKDFRSGYMEQSYSQTISPWVLQQILWFTTQILPPGLKVLPVNQSQVNFCRSYS